MFNNNCNVQPRQGAAGGGGGGASCHVLLHNFRNNTWKLI